MIKYKIVTQFNDKYSEKKVNHWIQDNDIVFCWHWNASSLVLQLRSAGCADIIMGNTVRIFSTKYIQCNSSHSSINISILYSLQISNRHDTRIEFHLLATDWIDRKICHCLNMVTWENKSSKQNIYKWKLRPCIITWWEEI